jgi:non-heme chloroperoxidase
MDSGEVTLCLGRHGSARVQNSVLMGAIPPFLFKTDDTPEGVDQAVFDGIKAAVVADRPAFMKSFLDDFYDVDVLGGTRISEQARQNNIITAVGASAYAAEVCVDTWLTDFRDDLPEIDVPTLLVHGDATGYCRTRAPLPGCPD